MGPRVRLDPRGRSLPSALLPASPQPYLIYTTRMLASPHFTGGKLRPSEGKGFSEFCVCPGAICRR